MLSEICEWVGRLPNLPTKIPNSSLHGKLSIVGPWAYSCDFITCVDEGVDARAAEMKSINTLLVVQILKLLYKLDKVGMSLSKLGASDAPLCEYSDTTYKLTKVCPILVRKYGSENTWS
jgi:hypothetical protein